MFLDHYMFSLEMFLPVKNTEIFRNDVFLNHVGFLVDEIGFLEIDVCCATRRLFCINC